MTKNETPHNTSLKEIISYTLPELYVGKEWYVGFYAFDPVPRKMRRKKIKINFIKGTTKRRKYGEDLKKRVTEKLLKGWNPWIEAETQNAYRTIKEVFDTYMNFVQKMTDDGSYRKRTFECYRSSLRNIQEWNLTQETPITYIFQFNEDFCYNFLEYTYIEKKNSVMTRNNYLHFIKQFSGWCVQHRYFKTNPAEGITSLRQSHKQRTVIEEEDMIRLSEYLTKTNKSFLLACYLLTYCFIRPKEMSFLQLHHFSLEKQTIYIPSTISKNRKDATITLPSKVRDLMIDLKIFDNPATDYLFSVQFKPGSKKRDTQIFGWHWKKHVVLPLNFPPEYKFYSLKDTGITNMLRQYDTLTVRDQARHSSIHMTDKYTPKDIKKANDLLKEHEGAL